VKKFFVSGFVVFTFVAYALHERFARPVLSGGVGVPTASQPAPTLSLPSPVPPTAGQMALAPTQAPPTAPPPTDLPAPTQAPPTEPPLAAAFGQYKDGQYDGQTVDAFYGLVQVLAVIQNGKIANVQFLEYPNDRRTSVRINNAAMPMLRSEAIQAQSAEVDVISGATLTSEAFIMSLQSALQGAKV
jgi:uncharacterized protein with FMN-binding domain